MTFCPLTELAVTETLDRVNAKSVWDFGNQRYTGRRGFETTADFYADRGCEYTAIDINTRMGAIIGDLNGPLDLPPRDLVVNNGTSEHLFNQFEVLRNAHRLASKAILHVLPLTPWINHGFFNYNPILFRDLAAANAYEIAFHWIGNRWGDFVSSTAIDGLYVEKNPTFMDHVRRNIPEASGYFNAVLFLKGGTADFRTPLQGKYVSDIGSDGLKNAYG